MGQQIHSYVKLPEGINYWNLLVEDVRDITIHFNGD